MKAITIRQPWAQLIVEGRKEIENRTWATRYRGPIIIHASGPSHSDVKESEDCRWWMAKMKLGEPPAITPANRGAALGAARLVDCVSASSSPWFIGPHGFVLADIVKFENPIAMKGALGMWAVHPVFARAIDEAIALAAFERARQIRISNGYETACRGCGCSESRACVGGCGWYSERWCTACQDKAELQELYKAVQGGQR